MDTDFQDIMARAESYQNYAVEREFAKDYASASDFYMLACDEYQSASAVAWDQNDFQSSAKAVGCADYCKEKASQMDKKNCNTLFL